MLINSPGPVWGNEAVETTSPAEGSLDARTVRRRLRSKSSPIGTAYPVRPLVSRSRFQIIRATLKNKKAQERQEFRVARFKAINLLSRQDGRALNDGYDALSGDLPHETHSIRALHGDQYVIFCNSCGLLSQQGKWVQCLISAKDIGFKPESTATHIVAPLGQLGSWRVKICAKPS